MTRKYALIYSLLFFCGSFFSFISSAHSQACTPVVYAFRHAEDEGVHLTPVGRQHASLYPAMVASFGVAHNYCPVGFVYSMYDTNPNGTYGTYNPYETAQPLAVPACWKYLLTVTEGHLNPSFNLDTICNGALGLGYAITPTMALGNGNKLYEYLENTKHTTQPKATGTELVAELLSNASVAGGLSSAIFWSSQGLPTLGAAIASGTAIPADPKPSRNVVYVFEQQGTSFTTTKLTYRQCFNIKVSGPTLGGTTYYCSEGGNLPTTIDNLPSLQGKICDTGNVVEDCKKGP
jgi:hypothetical protein